MPRRPSSPPVDTTSRGDAVEHRYRRELRQLANRVVKFQRRLIARGDRVLVLFEGRDAAGKDGGSSISSSI